MSEEITQSNVVVENSVTVTEYEFVLSTSMFLLDLGFVKKLNPFLLSIIIIYRFLSITIQFFISIKLKF